MKEKEEMNNQGRNIMFKIVEKLGVSLEQKLMKSNPWGGEICGDCWREGVNNSLAWRARSVERRYASISESLVAPDSYEEEST